MQNNKILIWAVTIILCLFSINAQAIPSIKIHPLDFTPTIDGDGSEWNKIKGVSIKLHKNRNDANIKARSVLVKAGVRSDSVYFYLEWDDDSKDVVHKPWIWDEQQHKYIRGPQREDRLAMQFEISGDYDTDWFSGKEFVADMWHWKAFRSNTNNLAHDKMTTISKKKILRSVKLVGNKGKTLYISRLADKGEKLYKTKRYSRFIKPQMPKYILTSNPIGSVSDVHAKGSWKNGKWHLELTRKLNTLHPDDVKFIVGKSIRGGIAVFDHSENDQHLISDNLLFKF